MVPETMKKMSITKRLILQLTLVVALLWTTTAVISRAVFISEIDEIVTSNLTDAAVRLLPLATSVLTQKLPESGENEAHGAPRELDEELGIFSVSIGGFLAFQATDRDGHVLLRSYDAGEMNFPERLRDGMQSSDDQNTYTLTDPVTGISLSVAEPSTHRQDAIDEATIALFVPLLLLVPLLVLAIWLLTRSVLSPLLNLRREIAQRGGDNLTRIDSVAQPVELRPIVLAIDRLMKRLKSALAAERIFAANAAHELRTPLAGALAQTQRLKDELADAPSRERAAQVEKTLKRLSDYTEKLLEMSRIESGIALQKTRTNMTPVLDLVVKEVRRHDESAPQIVIQNDLNQDLMVAMDADSFAIALRNLLENAILHGDKTSPITLRIAPDWNVHVINRGVVVAEEKMHGLKQRFVRGDTLASGSGLGLAIVERIMKHAGGTLALHSPAIGQPDGFEAVMQLP
jgi:two-component system, OmpR family, sensor kinase